MAITPFSKKQKDSTSSSFEQTINTLYAKMKNFEVELQKEECILSPEAILDKITFLEKKLTEYRSIKVSFDTERLICNSSGNSAEIKSRAQWFTNLDSELIKIKKIWDDCHTSCRDIQIDAMSKMLDDPTINLNRLKLQLQQLLLYPSDLINNEQKESVRKLQVKVNHALNQLHQMQMEQESEEHQPLSVQHIPINQNDALEPFSLNNLDKLPLEVLFKILLQLHPEDLLALRQVNKALARSCNSPWEPGLSKKTNLKTEAEYRQYKNRSYYLEKGLYSKIQTFKVDPKVIHFDYKFYRHGNLLYLKSYSGCHQNEFKIFDSTTNQFVGTLPGSISCFGQVVIKNGNSLYASDDKTIKIWDLNTNQSVATLIGHTKEIKGLCIDNNYLYSSSKDKTIKIWDLSTNQCVATLIGHTKEILGFLINGNYLYSSSKDETIKKWDLTTNQCVSTLEGLKNCYSFFIEENLLYSNSSDGIKIWDLTTNECVDSLGIFSWHFFKAGNFLYFTADGQRVQMYDLTLKQFVMGPFGNKKNSTFLRNGNDLYIGLDDGTIQILDLTTNQSTTTMQGHQSSIKKLIIKGNFLYSGSDDNTIKIWDLTSNQCVATLCGHEGSFSNFIENGNFLYSITRDSMMTVWDLGSWSSLLETAQEILDHGNMERYNSFGKACRDALSKELEPIDRHGDVDQCREDVAQSIYLLVSKEILSLLEKGSTRHALSIFKKLPSHIKNDIYAELYKIVEWKNDYFPCAEHAFWGHGEQITDAKRMLAIQIYIEKSMIRKDL
ncbi:MAG TPA: F-box/WD40 repeat-containing protein [Rhabdochlamydiaceae bacterium]|nr:F-box/WD40 repeat-containing protein [Rhabdochlamydiaceae bacterium]